MNDLSLKNSGLSVPPFRNPLIFRCLKFPLAEKRTKTTANLGYGQRLKTATTVFFLRTQQKALCRLKTLKFAEFKVPRIVRSCTAHKSAAILPSDDS